MSDERFLRVVPDPEVAADLQLRAATERDPNRMREMPVYVPAKIIGQVPCRARCGQLADWPEEAEHAFQTHNAILAKRDEAPLDKTRIVFCSSCIALGRGMQGARNRKHVDLMRDTIRELKASANPRSEHELIKKLDVLGHPGIKELLDAITGVNDGKSKRSRASDV